jgi:hypothetical protein
MRLCRLLTSLTLAAVAITRLGGVTVASSHGSLTFRATVSGKAHDAGSVSRSEVGTTMGTLIGCGVVKHRSATPYGRYNYIVRTGPTSFPGEKPTRPTVLLVVYRYTPGSARSYTHLDVGGTFAINGHAYAGHPTSASTERLTVSPDGRSGTWMDPDALRNYPATGTKPMPGFAFRATWHCSTVYHFHD